MHGKQLALLAIITAFLTACSVEHHEQAADATEKCEARYPAVKGQFVQRIACLNRATEKYVLPEADNRDLVTLLETKRLALAGDVDAGQITPAAYDLRLHRIEAEIDQEAIRRRNERSSAFWGISHGLNQTPHALSAPVAVSPSGPVPVLPGG